MSIHSINKAAILMVLGVLIRLVWILCVQAEPVSDALWYHEAARNLAESGHYMHAGAPTAFFPIAYPAFLGALYFLFGSDPFVGQFANVFLSFLILFFSYQLAKKWFTPRIALISLFILAIYPNHIAYCSLLLNELLFTAMLLGGFWVFSCTHKAWKGWAMGGFWLIACHIKPWLVVFPACLFLFYTRKYSWQLTGKVYVIILLFTALWAWRNARVMGEWIPFSTNGGINLLIGNNPHATGTYTFEGEVAALLDSLASEPAKNRQASAFAVAYIAEFPLESLKRMPAKLYFLFHHGNEGFYWLKMGKTTLPPAFWRAGSLFAQIFYLLLLGLFALQLGAYLMKKAPSSFRFRDATLFCLLLIFVYLAFFGYSRYHFPMLPFMAMFAAAFIYPHQKSF